MFRLFLPSVFRRFPSAYVPARRRFPIAASCLRGAAAVLLCLGAAEAWATSFTVNSLGDTGAGVSSSGDLRYCINQSNASSGTNTIVFAVTGTIFLGAALPSITSSLTIAGPGEGSLTISGGGANRVFNVGSGVTVDISGLTIANGSASNGGGLYNNGSTVYITNSAFTGNTASANGGAIFNTASGTVHVSGSTFSGNTIPATVGTGGGAIYNDYVSTVTVASSVFTGNSATANASDGGAIANEGSLTVSTSTFSGNTASSNSNGGAIYTDAGSATVTQSLFTSNSLPGAFGGAFYLSSGTATISGSIFSGNTVGAGEGGAVYAASGNLQLTNNTLLSNSAALGGGVFNTATLTATNNTFSGNTANVSNRMGGGIFNGATLTANNNIFTGNSAGAGGGMFNQATDNASNNVYYNNAATTGDPNCYACNSNTGAVLAASNPIALPLGYWGGPTQNFLPQPGSEAICAGSDALVPSGVTADQRGFPLVSSCVDAGADQTNYLQVQANTDSGSGAADCPGKSCTLRDAIEATGNAGDIDFASTVTSINLASGITLDAANGANLIGGGVTINGGGSGSGFGVFTVNSGTAAALYGIAVSNGNGNFGGGILNNGTLAILNSTVSGNLSFAGGGIDNHGALTVTESTIAGNTDSIDYGGGIANESGATLTIVGSTIANNVDDGDDGGGIKNLGTLSLANSIVAGNTSLLNSGSNIAGTYTDLLGNVIGGATNAVTNQLNGSGALIAMGPLQNNGGAMLLQTMLPLPGNPAICNGKTANNAVGITIDERGLPITNTTYPGYSSSTPCDDAGAVQTNYALAFTQQPSTSSTTGTVAPGVTISPAPAVMVTESGGGVTGASVSLAVAEGALSGTATQTTSGGTATFSGISISPAESGDTFTATLSLNPNLTTALSLTEQSFAFNVEDLAPALTSPSSSVYLGGPTVFTWSAGAGSSEFQLYVGTTGTGSSNIYKGPDLPGTATSSASINVPANGAPLYVRLWYVMNNTWQSLDYTFTEAQPPSITSPSPGTLLGGDTVFTWSPGVGASGFQVRVGTTGPGSHDLNWGVNLPSSTTSSASVTIPIDGATVYVRLWYLVNGNWLSQDYTYTEATPPSMTSPSTSTPLGGKTTFTWNPGSGADQFQIYIGNTGPGSNNVYWGVDVPGTTTSIPSVNIPLNAGTLYVRLWFEKNGNWQHRDYTYTAATPPSMSSPNPGSTIGGGTTFMWNPGSGFSGFQLYIGTTGPGSSDIARSLDFPGSATSSNSISIPSNGAALNVRLWYLMNGVWGYVDYAYTEAP